MSSSNSEVGPGELLLLLPVLLLLRALLARHVLRARRVVAVVAVAQLLLRPLVLPLQGWPERQGPAWSPRSPPYGEAGAALRTK